MTIRSTNYDVNAFLYHTRAALTGLQDKDLEVALKSADELVKLEAESTKTLREADIRQAEQRGGGGERASALMVMAYLAVKYPQLAGVMDGSAPSKSRIFFSDLRDGLSNQFGRLLHSDPPEPVLRDLERFVSRTEVSGVSPFFLIGSDGNARQDTTVHVAKNVASVEGRAGLLAFTPGEGGTFEVTLSKKEPSGYGAPKRLDPSGWSALMLDRMASRFASHLLPAKPGNALEARRWESEHGEKRKLLDDISAALRVQARVKRRENQKTNNTTSDELVFALDSFFAAAKEQLGGGRRKAAMCLDNVETQRELQKILAGGYARPDLLA